MDLFNHEYWSFLGVILKAAIELKKITDQNFELIKSIERGVISLEQKIQTKT